MYLNQYWKDERLAFSSEENKVLTLSGDFAEKIWVPDTFFANDKKRFVLLLYMYSSRVQIFLIKKCLHNKKVFRFSSKSSLLKLNIKY